MVRPAKSPPASQAQPADRDAIKTGHQTAGGSALQWTTNQVSIGLAALAGLTAPPAQAWQGQSKDPAPHTRNVPTPQPAAGTNTFHTVKAGESFWTIAKLYNISSPALQTANADLDPQRLKIDSRVRIPVAHERPIERTVQTGDSFWKIAKESGITVDQLAQANPGVSPTGLQIGQKIKVPQPSVPRPAPRPLDDHTYVVKPKDTLFDIAKRYNVTVAEIEAANPGIRPDRIDPGQKLQIPGEAPIRHTIKSGDTSEGVAKTHQLFTESVRRANPGLRPEALKIGQEVAIPRPTAAELRKMEILRSYVGKPYGPSVKNGQFDCVTLVRQYAKDSCDLTLSGNRGDQYFARHTTPIATLNQKNRDLSQVRPGDIVFIGHPYAKGEGSISAYHLGVCCEPQFSPTGSISDFSFVHASGGYSAHRTSFHGAVKEEESLLGYLDQNRSNSRRNHMFIGRLVEPADAGVLATVLPDARLKK